MRVMVLVKATEESEAGALPDEALLTAMARFNEEPDRATREEAFRASVARRLVDREKIEEIFEKLLPLRAIIVAGRLCRLSLDEAVEWLKRAPFGDGTEVEIRPVSEGDDFGEAFTPELRGQESRIAEKAAALQGGSR